MARGRFLSQKANDDPRLNSIPLACEFLYWKIITNLDAEGRMSGEPAVVKGKCYPLRAFTTKQVCEWLELLEHSKKAERGLITRYEVDGVKVIWCEGFDGEQRGLRKEREAPSVFPPPPFETTEEPIVQEPQAPSTFKPEPLDDNLKAIVKEYEDNIGIITPHAYEELKDISSHYPQNWFSMACQEAVKMNKRNLKYIEAILKRWESEGVTELSPKAEKKSAGMKVEK